MLVGAIAAGIIAAISNDAVEEALERKLCRPMVSVTVKVLEELLKLVS